MILKMKVVMKYGGVGDSLWGEGKGDASQLCLNINGERADDKARDDRVEGMIE
jgi:hypothetical protein